MNATRIRSPNRLRPASQEFDEAKRLFDDAAQFLEKRQQRLSLIVNALALPAVPKHAAPQERVQFSLKARRRRTEKLGQFAHIPPTIRLAVRSRQDPLAGLREERIDWPDVTHPAYMFTQIT